MIVRGSEVVSLGVVSLSGFVKSAILIFFLLFFLNPKQPLKKSILLMVML